MDPDTGTPGYLHAMYQITTEPTIVLRLSEIVCFLLKRGSY